MRSSARIGVFLILLGLFLFSHGDQVNLYAQDEVCGSYASDSGAIADLYQQAVDQHNEGIDLWDEDEDFTSALQYFQMSANTNDEITPLVTNLVATYSSFSPEVAELMSMMETAWNEAVPLYREFVNLSGAAAAAYGVGNFDQGDALNDQSNTKLEENKAAEGRFWEYESQVNDMICPDQAEGANLAIHSIQPAQGGAGEPVVINGSGFGASATANSVLFGSESARILASSSTSLTVSVPDSLSDGFIEVSVETGGETSNSVDFEFSTAFAARSIDDADESAGFMLAEVLIFLSESDPTAQAGIAAQLQIQYGFTALQQYPLIGLWKGLLRENSTEGETLAIVDLLSGDPRVDLAVVNRLTEPLQTGNSGQQDQSWLTNLGLENMAAFFPRGGSGITIAIIDTGLDIATSLIRNEITLLQNSPDGLNFAGDRVEDPTAQDPLGHGTAVTSIAAASASNEINGRGMAPNADVLAIRIFETNRFGQARSNSLWVAQALSTAYSMGADVINLSLRDTAKIRVDGEEIDSSTYYGRVLDNLDELINLGALQKRPVLVAATGNDSNGRLGCPACDPRMIAVGAVYLDDSDVWQRSEFSNYGEGIDMVAQGEDIMTTLRNGEYGDSGPGTSFASPQVAGLVALILGEDSELSDEAVKQRILACFIQDVGEDGYDEQTGWGRIFIPNPESASSDCRS